MNRLNLDRDLAVECELERVIEPLASYICAAEQPGAALLSALAALFSEVEQTNRAALAYVGGLSGHH
jgi:hypothetical protein